MHEPTEAFERPGAATPAASSTSTSWPRSCPLPADASQLRAIAEADAGRTFVLEGPPGTGKSQTITNLLTRAVAEGKRVLFVAEKRAALDVVARRLDAVGMGMFALDLHDKGSRAVDGAGADPAGAGARGRRRRAGPGRRRGGPALGPPRCWPATPTGCTTTNAAGLSLYSARTAGAGRRHRRRAAAGARSRSSPTRRAEVLTAVRPALALLPDIADLTRPSPRHPWAFVDSPDIDLPATQAAAAAVDARRARGCRRSPSWPAVLRRARTPDELDALAHVLGGPAIGLDVIDETFTELWTAATVGGAGRDRGVHRVPPPGPRRRARREALDAAAGRDLRGRADRRGVVLVGPPAPADRRPRPARARTCAPRRR